MSKLSQDGYGGKAPPPENKAGPSTCITGKTNPIRLPSEETKGFTIRDANLGKLPHTETTQEKAEANKEELMSSTDDRKHEEGLNHQQHTVGKRVQPIPWGFMKYGTQYHQPERGPPHRPTTPYET